MQPLDKILRHQLERAVKSARDTAENGADAALGQLGVADPTPAAHLSDAERDLRRRLRAHGRQLGDSLNGGKIQSMDRLVEEVAYEHWHRMLFARFLAENNLLMYPDPDEPVSITLEECGDLAADEGAANGWELAARYAAQMLPQIFRLDSAVFQLTLSPEHQQALERLVSGLPQETFTASDSLGWVYQFWQANNKERINKSEVKIGARELPAVTQLFTEPYMVSFLLDNALGAWWAARTLTDEDLKNAQSEEELRQKAAIPGVPLEYLRFVKISSPHAGEGQANEEEVWTPAAGNFDAWPENLAELKALDPCCGSGHFLVAAFLMLVPMRMEQDGFSAKKAVDAVLRENIHGLELDQRCVELAAFALALTAWKYPNAGGYRILPELNVACSGLSVNTKKENWLALAGDNTNLRIALEELYKQFKDAPVLGSLINPEASLGKGSLFELKWDEVGPLLTKALAGEKNDEKSEMGAVAKGIAKASVLLSQKYTLAMTNVPYLGKGKMNETLLQYLDKNYSGASNDLATSLIERMEELLIDYGHVAFVSSQNWMFLGSFSAFRKQQLKNMNWKLAARLGYKSFSTQMYDFPVILGIFEKKSLHITDKINSVSVEEVEHLQKSKLLCCSKISSISQEKQLNNPQFRLTFDLDLSGKKIPVKSTEGLSTGDSAKFICCFWEMANKGLSWDYFQASPSQNMRLDGLSTFIRWENGEGELAQSKAARIQGHYAWGKQGVIVGRVGDMRSAPYLGKLFDKSAVVLTPQKEEELLAIYSFCTHPGFSSLVRQLDKKLGVATSVFESLPFDLEHWTKVAEERHLNDLPKPYTNDSAQWIFHGHPCGSVVWDKDKKWTAEGALRNDDTVLQVAVARLLGYHWPAELDEEMELAEEQREWVNRCEALLHFSDEDGIVCIPPVRGEASAADRLLNLLAAAYDDAWSNDVLTELLKNAGHAGKTLETWLRDKFFTQHCKLFQNRPFIWHVWDGLPDGFSALVNYHKLDRKNLETLIYTYLGDWTSRQKQDINNSIDGADERLAAAEALKKKLEQILEGEAPYDIFVRWKPIEQQPIGWEPDLNDGVRLNIRPFLTVDDVKKKGAGILRDKANNIKWTKDRGKDVESAPWHHTFGGERINDHHLSLAEKRAAQEQINKGKGA